MRPSGRRKTRARAEKSSRWPRSSPAKQGRPRGRRPRSARRTSASYPGNPRQVAAVQMQKFRRRTISRLVGIAIASLTRPRTYFVLMLIPRFVRLDPGALVAPVVTRLAPVVGLRVTLEPAGLARIKLADVGKALVLGMHAFEQLDADLMFSPADGGPVKTRVRDFQDEWLPSPLGAEVEFVDDIAIAVLMNLVDERHVDALAVEAPALELPGRKWDAEASCAMLCSQS